MSCTGPHLINLYSNQSLLRRFAYLRHILRDMDCYFSDDLRIRIPLSLLTSDLSDVAWSTSIKKIPAISAILVRLILNANFKFFSALFGKTTGAASGVNWPVFAIFIFQSATWKVSTYIIDVSIALNRCSFCPSALSLPSGYLDWVLFRSFTPFNTFRIRPRSQMGPVRLSFNALKQQLRTMIRIFLKITIVQALLKYRN